MLKGAFLWVNWVRINDKDPLNMVYQRNQESLTRVDSSVLLMHDDPSNVGSLI